MATYHERDEPHVRPYLEHVQEITEQVCGALECPPDSTLEVDLPSTHPRSTSVRAGASWQR